MAASAGMVEIVERVIHQPVSGLFELGLGVQVENLRKSIKSIESK